MNLKWVNISIYHIENGRRGEHIEVDKQKVIVRQMRHCYKEIATGIRFKPVYIDFQDLNNAYRFRAVYPAILNRNENICLSRLDKYGFYYCMNVEDNVDLNLLPSVRIEDDTFDSYFGNFKDSKLDYYLLKETQYDKKVLKKEIKKKKW